MWRCHCSSVVMAADHALIQTQPVITASVCGIIKLIKSVHGCLGRRDLLALFLHIHIHKHTYRQMLKAVQATRSQPVILLSQAVHVCSGVCSHSGWKDHCWHCQGSVLLLIPAFLWDLNSCFNSVLLVFLRLFGGFWLLFGFHCYWMVHTAGNVVLNPIHIWCFKKWLLFEWSCLLHHWHKTDANYQCWRRHRESFLSIQCRC